jgi:hypothetical protein
MMSLKSCPVPKSQQPVNEYNSLKYSIEFGWTHSNTRVFLQTLTYIFLATSTIWSIILYSNNIGDVFKFTNFLVIINITDFCILLILVRYYISWTYIYSRLIQATVNYEESGWYDGQTWVKPAEVLLQDRLVATYELLPVLFRIKQVVIILIFFILLGLLVFKFIIP